MSKLKVGFIMKLKKSEKLHIDLTNFYLNHKYFVWCSCVILLFIIGIITKPAHLDWVNFFGALGPVFISAIVGYVAYMQYHIEAYNQKKYFEEVKIKALEDLYNILVEALNLTEEDYLQSIDDLKNSKRGQIIQKLHILNIRFKIMFSMEKIDDFVKLFEENFTSVYLINEYRKNNDTKEAQKYVHKSIEISSSIQELYKKILQDIINMPVQFK